MTFSSLQMSGQSTLPEIIMEVQIHHLFEEKYGKVIQGTMRFQRV